MKRLIYRITNTITNDCYVGQTIQPLRNRFAQHLRESKRGSPSHFHRAIRKYGNDTFTYEQLEEVADTDDINERECFWISQLSPTYNMTAGGEGGKGIRLTEERKAAISRKMKGLIPWNKGKTGCYTKSTLELMSTKRKELCQHVAVWNKGIPNPLAADNGKRGAKKLSKLATGRRRRYLPDGSWTWEYPSGS